jgi:hypothetical protein
MAVDSTRGIAVARSVSMARRVTALFAMAALVGLLVILVWRVYLHHERGVSPDEPAVVALQTRAA